jgi:hypothetical protein
MHARLTIRLPETLVDVEQVVVPLQLRRVAPSVARNGFAGS